jgi:chromate transporter
MSSQPAAVADHTDSIPVSTIFFVFSRLAMQGFGGVMPFAYRSLVEQHRWLSAEEFARCLAMSQMLPGPTICNVSLMVGNRYGGIPGALAALGGMLAGPFLVVIALGMVYQQYGEVPLLRHAVSGMAAVAAGLILATAVKMGKALFAKGGLRQPRSMLRAALLALAFIGLGLLKWRLMMVFLLLAPLGAAAFYLIGEKK